MLHINTVFTLLSACVFSVAIHTFIYLYIILHMWVNSDFLGVFVYVCVRAHKWEMKD